jgi:hypothetical protein
MGWIPGWDSIAGTGWWSGFYFWASIACLIGLGIAEVASHRYSGRMEDLTAAEQTKTQRRHDDEMARLQLETAKANERAAELNAALEKEREKTSPRTWTKEQFDAVQAIRGKVTDVGILVQQNCLECVMFAGHLELALHQAGVHINQTMKLTRTPNELMRPSGENLSDDQTRRLIEAARGNRYGQRGRPDDRACVAPWLEGERALRADEDNVRGGPTLCIRRAKVGASGYNPLIRERDGQCTAQGPQGHRHGRLRGALVRAPDCEGPR